MAAVQEVPAGVEDWEPSAQKALEFGLTKFGRDDAERWDKIARMVTDAQSKGTQPKSAKDCKKRYLWLAKMMKAQKEAEQKQEEALKEKEREEAEVEERLKEKERQEAEESERSKEEREKFAEERRKLAELQGPGFRQPSKKEIEAAHAAKNKKGVRQAKTGPRHHKPMTPAEDAKGKKK